MVWVRGGRSCHHHPNAAHTTAHACSACHHTWVDATPGPPCQLRCGASDCASHAGPNLPLGTPPGPWQLCPASGPTSPPARVLVAGAADATGRGAHRDSRWPASLQVTGGAVLAPRWSPGTYTRVPQARRANAASWRLIWHLVPTWTALTGNQAADVEAKQQPVVSPSALCLPATCLFLHAHLPAHRLTTPSTAP
jgi:hypothetical protein